MEDGRNLKKKWEARQEKEFKKKDKWKKRNKSKQKSESERIDFYSTCIASRHTAL